MKSKRSRKNSMTLSSPIIAVTVGLVCLACYVQMSYSASIPASSSTSTTTTSKRPSKITTLRTVKPRLEVQAGRMKASDIKACISKAFCEVNSASDKPNYAVNQEFFDMMNRMHALSDEELDSGSTSVEYDDDDEEEDDDAGSSEESSSERHRGYPPPPPGYGRYGRNMMKNSTTVEGELQFTGNGTSSTTASPKKLKDLKKKGKRTNKKKSKVSKKYVNGTLVSVPKRRRSRLETKEEKAEKDAYVTRKQREMGQVNDLAALIRISADIGLTLRSPRKCRTLFNKCTMSHEQIVDLFNQTLLAVTTPQSGTSSGDSLTSSTSLTVPTTKRAKVTQTTATTTLDSEPISTIILDNNIIVKSTPAATTVTTQSPTTVTPEDVNRSSKSRHEFSDEDVEYLTDTEIAPVQTYALFVNDAPEETVKTQEEVSNVQETFKKYANAFPAEAPIPGNLPSLRKRSNKKSLKKHGALGRSSQSKSILRRKSSSEEDDEEDDDPEGSTSVENNKSDFRIEKPYPGYRIRPDENEHEHEHEKDEAEDDDAESAEPVSLPKESNEGILPPLVQKERPKMKEEDDEDEEDDAESDESMDADEVELEGKGFGAKAKAKGKTQNAKKTKATSKPGKVVAVEEEESSEEDEVEHEHADDNQAPPPWTPVYQMYMREKQKEGHKKKQKGPYKGGEPPYPEHSQHGHNNKHGHGFGGLGLSSLTSKKPWGGSSASQEIGGGGPSSHSHEGVYGDAPYHHQSHHAGPPGPYGGGPLPGSQETGGTSEQKPGFFQSILSWFSGGSKASEPPATSHQVDGPYGSPASSHLPYGSSSGSPPGHGSHSYEHVSKPLGGAGAPWPTQPDPAGVGHFGQSYRYRYKKPVDSSEEDSLEEVLEDEPIKAHKRRNKKRRYNGRSDSIIPTPPKKTLSHKKSKSTSSAKPGPPPPVVIMPKKEGKSTGKSPGASGDFDKLVQLDGGLNTGSSNTSNKKKSASNNDTKRTKKAAVKPKKKSQKPAERAQPHRSSRESAEDDDEAFSSEELYNQQVAKLKSGSGTNLGGSSSSSTNSNGNLGGSGGIQIVSLGGGSGNKPTKSSHESPSKKNNGGNNGGSGGGSFPSYFESMFGTQEKDKFKIKGKDDGSLLFGFDSLSSTLNASPLDVPVLNSKKKPSTYKVNKTKKQKKGNSPPVQFNQKEVVESSEEDDKKK